MIDNNTIQYFPSKILVYKKKINIDTIQFITATKKQPQL